MATTVQDFLKANPNYVGYANKANRTQAPTPQAQKKGKKGSGNQGFLSSIISELAGAGGAAGGAAIGAGIGSVVPGIGTAIGGLVGAGIGGFVGGTGGRLAENQIRDNEMRLGDALKEGALSGVSSVIFPGGKALASGGKAAMAGGKSAFAQAAGSSLDKSFSKAATGALGRSGARMAGGTANKAAGAVDDPLIAGMGNIERFGMTSKASAKGYGFGAKIPGGRLGTEDVAKIDDFVKRYGISGKTPSSMQAYMDQNKVMDTIGKKISSQYANVTEEFTDAELKAIEKSIRADLAKSSGITMTKSLDKMVKDKMAKLANSKKVSDLWEYQKGLKSNINWGANPDSKMVDREVINRLIRQKTSDALSKKVPGAAKLNKDYGIASELDDLLRNTGGMQDSIKSGIFATAINSGVGRGVRAAGSGAIQKTGKAVSPYSSLPIGANAVRQAPANIMEAGTTPPPNQLQDMGGDMPQEPYSEQIVNNGVLTSDALYGSAASNFRDSGGMPPDQAMAQGGGQVAPQEYTLQQALADAYQLAPNASESELLSYAKALQADKQSKAEDLTAVQRNKIAGYNTANSVVDSLEQLWQTVPQQESQLAAGISGAPGIKQIRSTVDPNVRQYTQFAEGTLAPIIKSLGETGVLTDRDIVRAYGLIPNLQDSSSVAAKKIQELRKLLTRAESATKNTGGGGATLDSALMEYGVGQ